VSHTPGPWKWDGGLVTTDGRKVLDHAGRAFIAPDRSLIAAAPDLLDMAQAWLEFHSRAHEPSELFEMADRTHAAIAKAKGEG
jgi:hypothetical protein